MTGAGVGTTPPPTKGTREAHAARVEHDERVHRDLTAVHEQTVAFVKGLTPEDLDRVVDERWDPPVTLGVRLVSVINDGSQHVGQAAYVRGLLRA